MSTRYTQLMDELEVRPYGTAGVRISVRAKPRSSRSQVLGCKAGALQVALTAPPVDGKANAELIVVVARWLGISRSRVSLVAGQSSKQKVLAVSNLSVESVRARLKQS